jgi:hypothetical protein
VELEIAVELGLDVDGSQRELVDVGSAAERRGLLLVRVACSANDLLTEGTRSEPGLLGLSILLALPAPEVKVAVLAEVAKVQIEPVEAGNLLLGTLVVRVGRAGERGCPVEL